MKTTILLIFIIVGAYIATLLVLASSFFTHTHAEYKQQINSNDNRGQ